MATEITSIGAPLIRNGGGPATGPRPSVYDMLTERLVRTLVDNGYVAFLGGVTADEVRLALTNEVAHICQLQGIDLRHLEVARLQSAIATAYQIARKRAVAP